MPAAKAAFHKLSRFLSFRRFDPLDPNLPNFFFLKLLLKLHQLEILCQGRLEFALYFTRGEVLRRLGQKLCDAHLVSYIFPTLAPLASVQSTLRRHLLAPVVTSPAIKNGLAPP